MATGTIFAAILVPAGVGAIISQVMHTDWGYLFNIPMMMSILWIRLLGTNENMRPQVDLPTTAIVMMLMLAGALSIAMLNARIRAREVVRG